MANLREASPPRILIVDDDRAMIELVHNVLQIARCDVVVARTGEDALEIVRRGLAPSEQAIDLILLDLKMPGMDGYQVIQHIKQDQELRHIPIIITTALHSISDKAQGLRMGADDYLTKPFDPQEMLARIDVALRIRRSERALRQRNRELAALNEINRMVTSSLDLDEVLTATMQGVRELLQVEAGALVLVEADSGELVFRKTLSPRESWIAGRTLRMGEGIAGYTIQTGQPQLVNDVLSDEHFSPQVDGDDGFATRSVLCVPLVIHEEVIGAIELINKLDNDFTAEDLDLLRAVAASVAVAVENAGLYGELADFAEEIERSQAQLVQVEKMAAIGRLSASIAHEINNPLQAIHNALHLTQMLSTEPERQRQYMVMAQQEVERLIQIVRRMLDFYRPSRGVVVPTNVNQVVQNVLSLAGKRIQHGQIEVTTRLADDLPTIPTVADQIAQVFLNIVINAIEAMPNGGSLRIGTSCSEDSRWIIAAFRDSGLGLAPTVRENLFEPFHTTKSAGTGLGLAISYRIVEQHGGQIEVSSQPDSGTVFIVRLPTRAGGEATLPNGDREESPV